MVYNSMTKQHNTILTQCMHTYAKQYYVEHILILFNIQYWLNTSMQATMSNMAMEHIGIQCKIQKGRGQQLHRHYTLTWLIREYPFLFHMPANTCDVMTITRSGNSARNKNLRVFCTGKIVNGHA